MEFTHDALGDLKKFCAAFFKEQIALGRFGDGEEKMYLGARYNCSDGWIFRPSKKATYGKKLLEAIQYSHPNYYLGLRYPRSLKSFAWDVRNITTPPERLFDPCLFVNSRWARARKFFQTARKRCILVGSGRGCTYQIPKNCIEPEYNYKGLLAKLLKSKKPILLAAGPLANILIVEYLKAGGKQSIVDIGTVLDIELFGKPTRRYQRLALKKKPKPKKARPKKLKRRLPKVPRPKLSKRPKLITGPRFAHLRTRNSRKLRASRGKK